MVASRAMRAIRDLPLAASLALCGAALFFGGGALDGSLPWLGGAALVAALASLALAGVPSGLRALVPLAALTAWLAVSVSWSTLPDRSWVYANRAFVYLLFALLGLWLATRTRALALGLGALLGAVAVWALAGKVVPTLEDYGFPYGSRLRGAVGLWNQLALLGAFALPFALWRRRAEGALLAYVWLVVIALTGSRGGAAVAALVVDRLVRARRRATRRSDRTRRRGRPRGRGRGRRLRAAGHHERRPEPPRPLARRPALRGVARRRRGRGRSARAGAAAPRHAVRCAGPRSSSVPASSCWCWSSAR